MRASLVALVFAAAACSNGGHTDQPDAGPTGPQCSDGIDNDGDGKIDFPNDPGCLNPNQNSETDDCPTGPNCPECGNGKDDDGDGQVDYPADTGCTSASDTSEQNVNLGACGNDVPVLPLPTSGVATGQIVVGPSHMISNCGGLGPETAYELDVSAPTVVTVTTDVQATAVDTVLYIRGAACTDNASELGCNDNASSSTSASTIPPTNLAPGTYYIIVDAGTSSASGSYELHVQQYPGVGEACDAQHACAPGFYCRPAQGATTDTCQPPHCQDGVDDDSDGKIDYPNDPGCTAPSDDDETDDCPSGPNCPACANGVDDDGDTLIDFGSGSTNDPQCLSASQPVEGCGGEQDPMMILTGAVTGNTNGRHDDWTPSCGTSGEPDEVWFAQLPKLDSLTISTAGSGFDTVLALYDQTCGTELACNDEGPAFDGTSEIDRNNVPAGFYAIVVDGWDAGAYHLAVTGVISAGGRCDVPLYASGALACAAGSVCDGSICKGQLACNNGVDDDHDGKIDYPDDPGCSSPTDDDETDDCPTGPNCPECANGKDDDGDGQTDYPADTACTSASGTSESCASMDPIGALTSSPVTGDTTGLASDFEPTCSFETGAPDAVYQLDVPDLVALHLAVDTGSTWFPEIELLGASCGGTAVACESQIDLSTTLAAGRYFVVVDGDFADDFGAYTLTASGTIAAGGRCDGALAQSGALTCDSGYICKGTTTKTCQKAACNDGADNDKDGKTDYPNDPGCDSPSDDDETDNCPSGAGCPVCSNGKDDDLDGLKDYPADFGCASAAGTTEVFCPTDQDKPTVIGTPTTSGTTVGAHDDFAPDCASATGAPDKAYALVLPVAVDSLTIDTDNSPFDTVLMLTDNTCAIPSLACDDNGGTGTVGDSSLTMSNVQPGAYGVIVDGNDATGGPYLLHVNGVVKPGTNCTSSLFVTGVLTCPAGEVCKSGTCQ